MLVKSFKESSILASWETIGFGSQTIVTKEWKNSYKKYSDDDLCDCVLGWDLQKQKTDMKTYCMSTNVPRTILNTYMTNIPRLVRMRRIGGYSLEEVEYVYEQ